MNNYPKHLYRVFDAKLETLTVNDDGQEAKAAADGYSEDLAKVKEELAVAPTGHFEAFKSTVHARLDALEKGMSEMFHQKDSSPSAEPVPAIPEAPTVEHKAEESEPVIPNTETSPDYAHEAPAPPQVEEAHE